MGLNNTTIRGAGGENDHAYTVPIIGKSKGSSPSVILLNPRYGHNVGNAMRACSCWGIPQLWWTGERVAMELAEKGAKGRLPREERMKGFRSVQLYNHDRPLDFFENVTPVAVELLPGSENLVEFEHPENAVYIFGPEDGSVDKGTLRHCHRFIQIPTKHCLNLAAAVNIVLYDRQIKRWAGGLEDMLTPAEMLQETRGSPG